MTVSLTVLNNVDPDQPAHLRSLFKSFQLTPTLDGPFLDCKYDSSGSYQNKQVGLSRQCCVCFLGFEPFVLRGSSVGGHYHDLMLLQSPSDPENMSL